MNSFITYAHRGASEYCPENTLMSFYISKACPRWRTERGEI